MFRLLHYTDISIFDDRFNFFCFVVVPNLFRPPIFWKPVNVRAGLYIILTNNCLSLFFWYCICLINAQKDYRAKQFPSTKINTSRDVWYIFHTIKCLWLLHMYDKKKLKKIIKIPTPLSITEPTQIYLSQTKHLKG